MEPPQTSLRVQASEWRLDVGHAMDTLRSDVTELFSANAKPNYDIFSRDVVLEDARVPSFRIQGLEAYRATLDVLRWSVRAACDGQRMEITSMRLPVNGVAYIRWRLHLWPKDPLAPAKDFLTPSLGWNSPFLYSFRASEPTVVEGYSHYEFDPWSAEIIRHTIDITNPPMLLEDLLQRHMPMSVFDLGVVRLPQAVPFGSAGPGVATG